MTFTNISNALQKGQAHEVKELIRDAVKENIEAKEILSEGLIAGMTIIGEKFKRNEVFVPEVLIAARAMNAGLEILRPILANNGNKSKGKAIVCTVEGDLHDIGKNLVKMMIEGRGIDCIDIGVDCSPEKITEAVIINEPDVLCLSALLTTTMMNQKVIIDELKKANVKDKVKVLVGGAPVTEDFAREIGADGYAADAASAADLVMKIINEKKEN